MTSKLDVKLRYFPTQRQWDAISDLHKMQQATEEYSGKWLVADTVRSLIEMPYVANNYPKYIKRLSLKTVNASKYFIKDMSPALPDESGCAHIYRLLTSGLIQMGYLKADEPMPQRSPRKCSSSSSSSSSSVGVLDPRMLAV